MSSGKRQKGKKKEETKMNGNDNIREVTVKEGKVSRTVDDIVNRI